MTDIDLPPPMVPARRDRLASIGGFRAVGRVAGALLKTAVTHPNIFFKTPGEALGYAGQEAIERRNAAVERIVDTAFLGVITHQPSILLSGADQMQHVGANLLRTSYVAGLPPIGSSGLAPDQNLAGLTYREGPPVLFGK